MAQVDARKAGKPYKQKANKAAEKAAKAAQVTGRKEKDGTTAVVKLETLRVRLPNLIDLTIKVQQARAELNEAVTATAEACGLLSATVAKFVKARAGDNFLEQKAKAQQLALCFEELGPLDDDKPKGDPIHPSELFDKKGEGRDPDDDDGDGDDGPEDEPGATVTTGGVQPGAVH